MQERHTSDEFSAVAHFPVEVQYSPAGQSVASQGDLAMEMHLLLRQFSIAHSLAGQSEVVMQHSDVPAQS
jgi:hypothetical protein